MKNHMNIICIGMLDTKGNEIKYIANEIENLGGNPIIMDVSMHTQMEWADISVQDTLDVEGKSFAHLSNLPRSDASEYISSAVAKKIMNLYDQGMVDGIISWAGSMGTTVATAAMRALPIGVPKVMLSTVAARDVSKWVGVKDIFMCNPISEKGVNKITRKTVRNAVHAVFAMAEVAQCPTDSLKKLGAVTLYGTTTPLAADCANFLETKKNMDVLYFHQTGIGAVMEEFIEQGEIDAIFDVTPGEISKFMYYPSCMLQPCERLSAAVAKGIPHVCAPGGLDQIPIALSGGVVPEEFMKGYRDGSRKSYRNDGKPYMHNQSTCIIFPTLEENKEMAHYIIQKLNKAIGPTVFILPMQGWSAYDQTKEHAAISTRMGWSADTDAPQWIPSKNDPTKSQRAVDMLEIFKDEIDRSNDNLDILCVDMHILDESFAELCCKVMNEMLDGTWKKGMFKEYSI